MEPLSSYETLISTTLMFKMQNKKRKQKERRELFAETLSLCDAAKKKDRTQLTL